MATRVLSATFRTVSSRSPIVPSVRNFQTSSIRQAEAIPLPVRRPTGAFRGGLYGFLLGSTLAGAGVSYYILDEYKVSNELLTEDIYNYTQKNERLNVRSPTTQRLILRFPQSLQASIQRVHAYVQTLEERLAELDKKQK